MVLETGLVSYWKLDEASGTRVDSNGSNDLSVSGDVLQDSSGKFNAGADINGPGNEALFVSDASQTGLDGTTTFSASVWFNTRGDGSNAYVLSKLRIGVTPGWYLRLTPAFGRVSFFTDFSGGSALNTQGDFKYTNNSDWHHAVIISDGSDSSQTIYVNGVLAASGTNGGGTNDSGADFALGNRNNGTTGNFGEANPESVDEVGFWSKALTVAEIEELYNSGSGLQFDNENPGAFDDIPPICWNYTAPYKGSMRTFKLSGPGAYPNSLNVPGNVDVSKGKMIDDGRLIDPDNYDIS